MRVSQRFTRLAALLAFSILASFAIALDGIAGYFLRSTMFVQLALLFGLVTTAALASNLAVRQRDLSPLVPLFAWLCLLAILNVIPQFGPRSPRAGEAIVLLITTTLVLTAGAMGFLLTRRTELSGRLAVAPLTLALVGSALLVIADPIIDIRSSVPGFTADLYERTRAGGLYLQPNIASTGLPLLFLALLPRLSRPVATALAILVTAAVVLTFSRSGLLLTAFVMLAALVVGRIPRWTAITGIVGVVLIGGIINIPELLIEVFGIDSGSGFNRLMGADRFLSLQANLEDSRASLASDAFSDFLKAPIVGHGPGYSWEWADNRVDRVGTHNIYLRNMLEFGILGAFLWPSLLLAFYRMRQPGLSRYWSAVFLSAGLLIGAFSHNLTEQGAILIPLLAAFVLPLPRTPSTEAARKEPT